MVLFLCSFNVPFKFVSIVNSCDSHGRDCLVVAYITTNAVSSRTPLRRGVRDTTLYFYVKKFVCDLLQVGGFFSTKLIKHA